MKSKRDLSARINVTVEAGAGSAAQFISPCRTISCFDLLTDWIRCLPALRGLPGKAETVFLLHTWEGLHTKFREQMCFNSLPVCCCWCAISPQWAPAVSVSWKRWKYPHHYTCLVNPHVRLLWYLVLLQVGAIWISSRAARQVSSAPWW